MHGPPLPVTVRARGRSQRKPFCPVSECGSRTYQSHRPSEGKTATLPPSVDIVLSSEPAAARHICQVGCGVGNALCPVLAANPAAVGFGCDFSPTAVACLQAHPQYDAARTRVWVDDVTAPAGLCGPGKAPGRGVDFATFIFVLSAIAPDSMPQVSQCVHLVLMLSVQNVQLSHRSATACCANPAQHAEHTNVFTASH